MKGNLIRLFVTGALLYLIVTRVDWTEFRTIGAEVRLGHIFVAYLLNLLMVALNTVRWQVLVAALGTRVAILPLTGYYFVCMFFNNFMPTSIGGDVMRVLDLAGHTGKKSSAMASILVERLLGLYALMPISVIAFILLYSSLPKRGIFLVAESGMAVLFLVGTILIRRTTLRKLQPLFRPFEKWIAKMGIREKGGRLYDHLDLYKGRMGVVLAAFVFSILSRVVWIVACWIFGRAIGLDLPPAVFFLLMPLVEVGRMLPISLGGVGIREGMFVIILGLFGVGPTAAVFVSILVYGVFILNGLIGGVIYGLRGFFSNPEGSAGENV